MCVPQYDDVLHAQIVDTIFDRCGRAVMSVMILQRRDEVGYVADDEQIARVAIENQRRVDT